MKGYAIKKDGKTYDLSPCGFCKHKNKRTVSAYCYNCIDTIDLALHKPNYETNFACFCAADEESMNNLLSLQKDG